MLDMKALTKAAFLASLVLCFSACSGVGAIPTVSPVVQPADSGGGMTGDDSGGGMTGDYRRAHHTGTARKNPGWRHH